MFLESGCLTRVPVLQCKKLVIAMFSSTSVISYSDLFNIRKFTRINKHVLVNIVIVSFNYNSGLYLAIIMQLSFLVLYNSKFV